MKHLEQFIQTQTNTPYSARKELLSFDLTKSMK